MYIPETGVRGAVEWGGAAVVVARGVPIVL